MDLMVKGKKNSKKGSKGGKNLVGEKKRDMSKVRCFTCNKFRHYVVICPHGKKNKMKKSQTVASEKVEYFSTQFEREFSLVVCLGVVSTTSQIS